MAASSFYSFISTSSSSSSSSSSSISSSSSSSSSSSPSSSSSSSHVKRLHVFPSFHGPDVRRGFLSHLHNLFARKEITIFKDQEIERGLTIGPELVKAIREARASIVLISKNYASSSWCLDELVEILKCKEALGQIVMPVFYEVDPSDVRKQRGDFGTAFQKTCEGKTGKQKRRWSKALTCVAEIAGEHSRNWTDEAAMVEKLSTDVSNKLKEEFLKGEFRSLDIDRDGFITAAELRYGLTKDGGKVTDEQVSIMIRGADVDGDGRISYDEFVKFMAMTEAAMKVTDLEEELKAEFRALDIDQNGFVSAAEFQHVMTSLGEKVTDEDLSLTFRAADVDGDGQLSYDEYVKLKAMNEAAMDPDSEEGMKVQFRAFDVDQNGFISAAEFQQMMTSPGEDLTDEEAKEMIRQIDVDGDGQVNYDEFVKFMKMTDEDREEVKFVTDITLSKEEKKEMMESFLTLDVDRDGFITEAEYQYVMKINGTKLSDKEVCRCIRAYDVDGDGRISYDEFVKYMMDNK